MNDGKTDLGVANIVREGLSFYKENKKEYLSRSMQASFPVLCFVALCGLVPFMFSMKGIWDVMALIFLGLMIPTVHYSMRWHAAVLRGIHKDLSGEASLISRCYRDSAAQGKRIFKTYLMSALVLFIPALFLILPLESFFD